ncbi:hypothetical protein [Stutzerimonas kunmingensis]|uniref:hypothetical protein n=1 Tax=Stutzerimonas kunmingensis TaxID=1211807 RepID=UPI0028AF3797|nr:hypothetical protein [Stutzerimonas kunmingensis]
MPLQNRVDPYSQLHAVSSRGTFMGNRGRLHNAERQIVSPWKVKPWITCALSFKNYQRPKLMMPNSYTELFFLDEPTAYAAGHRPCAQCRRPAHELFKKAWARAFPEQQDLSAPAIDNLLHAARLNEDGSQRTWTARLAELPDGSMLEHAGECVLLWRGSQWRWSFEGYTALQPTIPAGQEVRVLTPEPIVRLFAAGLAGALAVHPSLDSRG